MIDAASQLMPNNSESSIILDFQMQVQENVFWCWSAVGTSCALYYNPESGWTQCKLATESLIPRPLDSCCKSKLKADCEEPWYLNWKLENEPVGSFVTTNINALIVKGVISFERVRQELEGGRPIACHVKSYTGKIPISHFVVITGCFIDTEKVIIQDCFNDFAPSSRFTIMVYSDFLNKYQVFSESCKVDYTFFTHNNAALNANKETKSIREEFFTFQ